MQCPCGGATTFNGEYHRCVGCGRVYVPPKKAPNDGGNTLLTEPTMLGNVRLIKRCLPCQQD